MNERFIGETIFTVDPSDQSVGYKDGSGVLPVDLDMTSDNYFFPFLVTGMDSRHDLALFANIIDYERRCKWNLGFLAISVGQQTILAPPEIIALDRNLQTKELAKRIATVTPDEMSQFSIDPLIEPIRRRYPNIHGLCR